MGSMQNYVNITSSITEQHHIGNATCEWPEFYVNKDMFCSGNCF